MDTDGYCGGGSCEYTSTAPQLAAGVLELIRTLGFKATMIEGRATLEGRDCGPKWRIQFTAYEDQAVFRLQRKRSRLPARPASRPLSSGRMIVGCEPIESVPVRCITVEHPSHMFLAGEGLIPTCNSGKSPMLAGIGLYGLAFDDEPGAEVYAAAATRDQASIMFRDARNMVDRSPELAGLLDVSVYNLAVPETRSFFRAVSSEGKGLDGKRVHMALIDELHRHPTAEVVDQMRKGTKGRRQPLIVEITNSGFDRESVCWHEHEYAARVLEGIAENDTWFAYVCQLDACEACRTDGKDQAQLECPRCDDFRDERVWIKANPNLDVSLPRSYLREMVDEAVGMPSKLNDVLRFNFCVWTQSFSRFFDVEKWQACSAHVPDEDLVGAPCYGGLDLGQSDDLCAWVRAWMLPDGRVAVRGRYWLPESALARFPHRPYEQWQRAGVLEVTEGDITDYDVVEQAVITDAEASAVRELAYDNRFAERMALHFNGHFGDAFAINTPQGYGLNEALRALADMVATGKLCHGGDPVLSWAASNLVVRHGTKGEIRPDKEKAREKIDPVVALVMALSRAILRVEEESPMVTVLG
jgi:phage terminase large subunit-like protein